MSTNATMNAVVLHQYGGPEILRYEEVPKPTLGEGDVLIRVEAAGVNPGEAKIRQGNFVEYHTLPLILGYDIAGTIAEVARGVEDAQVGDAVYTKSWARKSISLPLLSSPHIAPTTTVFAISKSPSARLLNFAAERRIIAPPAKESQREQAATSRVG